MKTPKDFFDEVVGQKKYFAPKALFDHLERWLTMPILSKMELKNPQFLKIMTTYVVRNFQGRRKGGVPVGKLDQFCLKNDVKINLFDTVAGITTYILRKRGVKELLETNQNNAVIVLAKAFDKTAKIKP